MDTDLNELITVRSLIVVLFPIMTFPSEKILHPVSIAPDFTTISFALISTSVRVASFSIEIRPEHNLEFFNLADEDILLNYDDTIVSWLIIFARSIPLHIVTSSLDVRYCKILGYILPPVIFKTFSCQITVTISFFIFLH
jgi:hypothetical protein